MKAFLDTSILVATFYGDHEHHQASIDLLLSFGLYEAGCAAHSLAEVYATLTSMPPPRRIGTEEALLFLQDIRARLQLIALEAEEYVQLIHSSASSHVRGGAIYDAIIAQCALKADAEVIYTWNVKDFLRLPEPLARRVKAPGSERQIV